jgi:hypothetical protein
MGVRELASYTSYSFQQLSNVETGRRTPSEAFSKEVDAALKTVDRFQRILWRVLEDQFPDWFVGPAREEGRATKIRTYQTQVVHGLFQTEDYARALMRAARPREHADRIETSVAARLGRQDSLAGENPPLVWTILDEGVLRRPIGSRPIMAAQLERVLEAAESPSNVFQILPFSAGAHAGLDGSFTLWSYDDRDDVLYVEGMLTGQLVEGRGKLAAAHLSYDLLQAASLPRDQSLEAIHTALKDYK